MMKYKQLFILPTIVLLSCIANTVNAQTDDIDVLLNDDTKPKKIFVKNAFKSSRVINGHSMEMLGKGVLDFRILHRFGTINGGYRELFGLDQASMRMGFDYGIHKNISIGIGRSTFNKEVDGFVKYRIVHQSKGQKAMPISLLWVSGFTCNTTKITDEKLNAFENRLGYYHQLIAGRKFGQSFTLQLSPTFVHKNLVEMEADANDFFAVGIGGRVKLSNRMALIVDTYPLLIGMPDNQYFPLSIGVDIETGGHVFQLHITNTKGMNEKAFISETMQNWGDGQIQFGFNLSRVFTIVQNTASSW